MSEQNCIKELFLEIDSLRVRGTLLASFELQRPYFLSMQYCLSVQAYSYQIKSWNVMACFSSVLRRLKSCGRGGNTSSKVPYFKREVIFQFKAGGALFGSNPSSTNLSRVRWHSGRLKKSGSSSDQESWLDISLSSCSLAALFFTIYLII